MALSGLSGWLYLLAGVVILGSVAVIPAHEELDRARTIQAKAEAGVERRRVMREEAGERLAALAAPSEALLTALAQTHLNLAPAGSRAIDLPAPRGVHTPHAVTVSETGEAAGDERSLLARLATGRPSRSLLIVLGAVCVLVGVLPAAETKTTS